MKTALLSAAALLCLAGTAHAQRESNITAGRLVQICSSRDARLSEACTAYIDGVSDAAATYQRLRPADGGNGGTLPGYICITGATTGVQLRQSVVSYLSQHPGDSQKVAGTAVLNALLDIYPCNKGQPGAR